MKSTEELLEEISGKLDYLPVMDEKIDKHLAKQQQSAAIVQFWLSMTPMNRKILVYTIIFGFLSALHISFDDVGGLQGLIRLALIGVEG